MPNEFVARNGVIALNNSIVTGSLDVTNGITGSLFGTSSWAVSASWAPGGTSTATGDKITTGSVTASVDINGDTFRIISGSSTFLYVSSSGNVGIGVISPAARLHISSSAIIQTGSSGTNLTLYNTLGGAGAFTSLDFQQYNINNLYTTASAASIRVIDDGNFSGHITFRTKGNTSTATQTERVRIESSTGNVGIGTTVPAAKLQVSGTVNVANVRGSGSLTTSSIFTVDGAAGRLFSVNDSLSGSLFSVNTIAGLPIVEAFSDNTVRIGQYGQRVLFVSKSRVGIGKETSLNANLDVSGSIDITGSLDITGSITSTGTITATTLVVQTITSSISYLTGSTRFGSDPANTHVFTGSISDSGSLNILGSSTLNGNTVVTGSFTVITGSTIAFQVIDTDVNIGNTISDIHTVTGSLGVSGSIGINGNMSASKILGNTTPTIAAGGGAGTSPTITITGSDVAGIVRLATGTSPTANSTLFTVTFSSAYGRFPYVVTTPGNFSASFVAAGTPSGTFTTASTTGFAMFTGQVALRPSTAYTWSYHVIGG